MPPRWVNESSCPAYCHSYTETIIMVVVTAIVMIDRFLYSCSETIPIPVVMAVPIMPIPIMVSSIAITVPSVMSVTVPAVISIPMAIFSAMLVSIPVRIPFASIPPVMMSFGCLVVVMVTFVSTVPFIASVAISPSVTAEYQ